MTVDSAKTPARPRPDSHILQCGAHSLDLSQPVVMAILNVTPDSFSDGGQLLRGNRVDPGLVRAAAERAIAEGAAIIDIGGESTRPGARAITEEEELARVLPAVQALRDLPTVLSLDSSTPEVIRQGLHLGVGMVNDVRALERPGALAVVAATNAAVCLMHMGGEPARMQENPHFDDVVVEVTDYLERRVATSIEAGVAPESIVVDPGYGFGKTLQHNLSLLAGLPTICQLGFPVLAGVSRKRTIGLITGRDEPEQRDAGSQAAAAIAVHNGAKIVRTHEISGTKDAIAVAAAIRAAGAG